MDKKQIEIVYHELASASELVEKDRALLDRAVEASAKAYAPYSGFFVGAAVRLDNGEVFLGNNQENASYPAGICGERTALFAAKAQYPDVAVDTVCITAKGSAYVEENPVAPCGICRQVFAEYEFKQDKPFRVILASVKGRIMIFEKASDLLPLTFFSSHLNK